MSLVEKCWMVTSKISVIAILMITGICFGRFVSPYMKKKKGAVSVSIVYVVVMLVLYIMPPQIDNFSAYLIGVLAAFLVMYAQDRRNICQKIFLAVATGLINRAYVYKKDEMSVKEMVMLMIPSLVGVTGYGILQYYLAIYEKDTGKSLIDTYGFYGTLSFLHYLISVVAILVMIVMFQNWKETQEEQRGQELVLNQISDMKKHIGEVEKLYQDIRSLRHDMGNHIQTLEHLVAHHNTDDAAEYMEHLKNEWDEVSPAIRTGSPVIDVILMEKLRESKEKQIRFLTDFHYPENTELNAFDLSVIMNNALNNCMENVSGNDPYISVSSFRENSVFLITIKNSFQGQLHFRAAKRTAA